MFFSKLKVMSRQGSQTIPDTDNVTLAEAFRGLPELTCDGLSHSDLESMQRACPTSAILAPFSLDMGRCLFCGLCERMYPGNVRFTGDYRIASSLREGLIVQADKKWVQQIDPTPVSRLYSKSLRLRQVCAGGDGACEIELDAADNVNFDMRRFGFQFTASPRHADGIVVTGPVTRAMSRPLHDTYDAVPDPKLLIVVGVDAISGGMFAGSDAIDRSFFDTHTPDLYIPGHPAHPLVVIDALRKFVSSC